MNAGLTPLPVPESWVPGSDSCDRYTLSGRFFIQSEAVTLAAKRKRAERKCSRFIIIGIFVYTQISRRITRQV